MVTIRRAVFFLVILGLVFFGCGGGFTPTPAAPNANVQVVGQPVTFCIFVQQCRISGTIINRGPDCASTVKVVGTATESAARSFPWRVTTEPQTVGPLAVGASARIDVCCLTHTYADVTFATGVTSIKCQGA